jgi:hypothetical protein
MAICGCGLPAHCCQPAVAGGFIYAGLWGELTTHLAFLTQSSPVREPLLQAFPFPSTLGEVTLHPFSQACMFIYSSCGKWVFPPLLWSFPPTATFTSFLAPDYWACSAAPASQRVCLQLTWEVGLSPSPVEFSSLHHSHKLSCSWLLGSCRCSCHLRLGLACLFTVLGGIPLPSSALRVPHPLCNVSLLFLLLITQFLFFSWVGGLVCPGGYADLAQGCLWQYRIPLSSLCSHHPKPSGHWHLAAAQGPSWFLCSMWSGDALCRLEVWRGSKFCLFSVALPARCVSSISPRFHFRRHTFCFLPLAAILESRTIPDFSRVFSSVS